MVGMAFLIILGETLAGTMLFVAFAYVVKAMAEYTEHEELAEREKEATSLTEGRLSELKA
jgi:hypothetical protein